MQWTNDKPNKTGYYWYHRFERTRMVKIWGNGNPFFTNEDGGAPLDDEDLYSGGLWYGPIVPPPPPSVTINSTPGTFSP